jgi:hypothetical protein
MRLLIHTQPLLFLGAKALLTASCLVGLLLLRDYQLAGGFRAGGLLYGALVGYSALILYELTLYSLVF